ncbi:MAG: amidohydrolase [Clostridia bacterium]|nr:amidohydrolase [Clostridia bacterium]
MESILNSAQKLQKELVLLRQELHQNAEVGFDLPNTLSILRTELEKLGLQCEKVGRAAISVTIGKKKGKTLLLRADTDALPIKEQTKLPFACKSGNMHACGHDLHATMLLGAARLLKEREDKLNGQAVLLFQPAEEILEGAKDCIESGFLKQKKIDGGFMLHVMTGVDLPVGTAVVAEGISAPAADYFEIKVKGKGCHGSTPWKGVDALSVSAHILVALQELSAREIPLATPALLTVGKLETAGAGNAISDFCVMQGTLRSFDEELRAHLKNRLTEIVKGVSKAFGAKGEVSFQGGCPTLKNDERTSALAYQTAKELLGEGRAFTQSSLDKKEKNKEGGSEDFAYFSHEFPTVMVALCAGQKSKGYPYPLHHPKVLFDESALSIGSALYTAFALKFLNDF